MSLVDETGAALLSHAHATACYHAAMLAPLDGTATSLSYAAFKETIARAAAYLCHGRAAAAPGAHPLIAQVPGILCTIRKCCGASHM